MDSITLASDSRGPQPFPQDILDAIERLRAAEYLDNPPHYLERTDAEMRHADLVAVFRFMVG